LTHADHIREMLKEGPITSYDVSVELSLPVTQASAHLTMMKRRGEVKIQGVIREPGRRPKNIFVRCNGYRARSTA
jgi:predicted ArsR family transcriptional regulator